MTLVLLRNAGWLLHRPFLSEVCLFLYECIRVMRPGRTVTVTCVLLRRVLGPCSFSPGHTVFCFYLALVTELWRPESQAFAAGRFRSALGPGGGRGHLALRCCGVQRRAMFMVARTLGSKPLRTLGLGSEVQRRHRSVLPAAPWPTCV